jgi:CelD/BcsL family acetyltransferase involved in cellulose biosynthesis
MNTRSYVILDPADLDGLEESWPTASPWVRFPTQEYSWVRSCAATFARDRGLHVVVTEHGGGLALAPLVAKRRGAVRLSLLGVDELFEPTDFVYSDETALAALCQFLSRERLPLNLGRVPADSPTVSALQTAFRGKGLYVNRPASPCPRIALDPGWAQPETRLTSSRRSLLRRMRRHAEAIGTVGWEVISPTASSIPALLDEAFRVEAASWKGREGTALEKDPVKGAFFRSYAERASADGALRLCFLRIGGRAAAMLLAVEYKGGFWTLKTGYDEEFASCSPGSLLFQEAIRYAAQQGLKSFEFLGSVEEWTSVWTDDQMKAVSLRSYPIGPDGAMALGSDALRTAAHRLGRIAKRKAAAS